MQSLFEPPPEVVAFLFVKKFAYLQIIAVLALVRSLIARSLARWLAVFSLLIALTGLAAIYGPAVMNITSGPLFLQAANIANAAQGLGILFAASAPLALSGMAPGRRWWGIDVIHFLSFAGLFYLWWATT